MSGDKRCGHTWKDGWGHHTCAIFIRFHNDTRNHRCDCDATTRNEEPTPNNHKETES